MLSSIQSRLSKMSRLGTIRAQTQKKPPYLADTTADIWCGEGDLNLRRPRVRSKLQKTRSPNLPRNDRKHVSRYTRGTREWVNVVAEERISGSKQRNCNWSKPRPL